MPSTPEPHAGPAVAGPPARPARVRVVEGDGPLIGLLASLLEAEGCRVDAESDAACAASSDPSDAPDLLIVDLPYPRQGGVDLIRSLVARHPAVPILALSSTFFACIECCGPVARELGVACVLPKPVSRDALTQAVRRLLGGSGGPAAVRQADTRT